MNCFRARRNAIRNCRSSTLRPASNTEYAEAGSAPGGDSGARACDSPSAVSESADVSSLARVADITRKLYHQGNAEGVLKTAASEIGENWRTTRCYCRLAQARPAAIERAGISHAMD